MKRSKLLKQTKYFIEYHSITHFITKLGKVKMSNLLLVDRLYIN